ncbi:11438_t:CDS:2 [Diversispora eburnea]|uniref:non-reducing end alpha-L-arabinofuranosidase n=1 Tax=Diversispora eburnea TaxID=1213867 RepID=A0A9N9BS22_9GLOM|nr:11438_t:CDS:2 [Diversispora eburnea]
MVTQTPESCDPHKKYELWIDPTDNSTLYKNDSTFEPHYLQTEPQIVSLESFNYPGYYVSHHNFLGFILKVNQSTDVMDDIQFNLVDGLDGQGYSFESVNNPGYYLRHQNYRIKLHIHDGSDLFKKDASFHARINTDYKNNTDNNPNDNSINNTNNNPTNNSINNKSNTNSRESSPNIGLIVGASIGGSITTLLFPNVNGGNNASPGNATSGQQFVLYNVDEFDGANKRSSAETLKSHGEVHVDYF